MIWVSIGVFRGGEEIGGMRHTLSISREHRGDGRAGQDVGGSGVEEFAVLTALTAGPGGADDEGVAG